MRVQNAMSADLAFECLTAVLLAGAFWITLLMAWPG